MAVRRLLVRAVLVLVLLLSACSAGAGDSDDDVASTTATTAPDAAGSHLEWYLSVLNGTDVDQSEFERRFAAEFREAVPLTSFLEVTEGLVRGGPYELDGIVAEGAALVATIFGTSNARFRISMRVDGDGQIAGLLVQPARVLSDPPTSIDETVGRLEEMGEVALLAATVDGDGNCLPLVDRAANQQVPIGSIFKLYVLGALADAIATGELEWDDELTLTAADRSISAAGLAGRPDGSVVTVREAAELMIAISDNTATDLLMRTLGRDAVEAALARYGHSDPSRNVPFPTTREMTLLKLDAEIGRRWATGDEAVRRGVLDELADDELDVDATSLDFELPLQPDVLEWFASPLDLCHALAVLWGRGAELPLQPLAGILTSNPGHPDESGRWTEIAFKGGSEPGLLAGAWLVESENGTTAVFAASVLNPVAPIDAEEVLLLMAAARDLLPDS